MEQFNAESHENERLKPLVEENACAHILTIMSKRKNPQDREFYIRMTSRFIKHRFSL